MANGLINASHISASSTWRHGQIIASRGRLYSSGVWCSRASMAVGDYKKEWFQVRFNSETTINGIAIQGDPNYYPNFITKFKLQYSSDGTKWINKSKEFIGNVDNINVVYNWFTTSMVATHVRLYATRIKRHFVKGVHACMRMELYGCLQNNILLPLGMSTGIIKDAQLQHSTGNDARNARLFLPGKGMYATSNNPIYLQVDLINAKTVTGISMQGVFRNWALLEILKYTLSYSNNKTTFTQFNQDFQENKDLGAVFNPLTPPTTMKHIRITTTICVGRKNSGCGIKVEIYGYDPKCSQMLTDMNISKKDGSSVTNVNIDSPTAWCATDASDYIHIKFNKRLAISGILLQGDSNEDGWVETYTINYGVSTNQDIKNLIGVNSRISPLSVNWLNPYIVTNYLRILPTSCKNGRCCLRFQLKGCPFVLEQPNTINGNMLSSTITFTWEEPISRPLPVDKYHLIIAASKNYPHKPFFETINTTTANLNYSVSSKDFAAATVQIIIAADIQGVMTSAEPFNFIVQPKDPPSPGLTKIFVANETNNATIVTLISSSDRNGPISYYEIVISTSEKTNLPNQLKSQAESELENLDYFLAATVKTNDLPANSIQYTFAEGKEYIAGLNARISTVGKYYFYVRAVIDRNDITKYGFKNISYYGNLSTEIIIDRNGLEKLVPEINNSSKISVTLVKSPSNLKYLYIIIMKVNISAWQEKVPSLYKQDELKTYETADYNEPYIAGIFNKTQLLHLGKFVLGQNSTYSLSSSSLRRRRSITVYRNGPLSAGEMYVVFQRLHVQDALYSTSWSKRFVVPTKKGSVERSSSSSSTKLIVGVTVASIVVVILIAVIFYKRYWVVRSAREQNSDSKDKGPAGVSYYQDLAGNELNMPQDPYEDLRQGTMDAPFYEHIPLNVRRNQMDTSQFSEFFISQSNKNYQEIRKEINSLVRDYDGKYLQDETKTVIEIVEIPSSNDQVSYSIFQGVQVNNTSEIWEKVFLEKFEVVVVIKCLNTLWSDKVLNCEKGESKKYGNYNVRLCETKVLTDHAIHEVEIKYGKHEHKFCVYEITALPLKTYVNSTEYLMSVCRAFKRLTGNAANTQISFIDMSGFGVDVILIVFLQVIMLIKEKDKFDIYNLFTMVVNKACSINVCFEQYLLIHKMIWEFITYDKKYVSVEDFHNEHKSPTIRKDDKGRYFVEGEFEEQYEIRKSLKITFDVASSQLNISKNRFRGILACDNKRVVLSQPADYINAVYVDSYRKRNAFIATQAPLEETVLDFWNMVVKENVSTIVMLYIFNEDKDIDYPIFWSVPKDNEMELEVKFISEAAYKVLVLRSFLVSVKQETHPVNILQLTNWPRNDVPKIEDIQSVIHEVKRSQEKLGEGTIVVTCSDGAYRSGTFIACMNALNQIELENGVDVFNILRCIRQSRPEFVMNEQQYRFIYEVVEEYVKGNGTYENL